MHTYAIHFLFFLLVITSEMLSMFLNQSAIVIEYKTIYAFICLFNVNYDLWFHCKCFFTQLVSIRFFPGCRLSMFCVCVCAFISPQFLRPKHLQAPGFCMSMWHIHSHDDIPSDKISYVIFMHCHNIYMPISTGTIWAPDRVEANKKLNEPSRRMIWSLWIVSQYSPYNRLNSNNIIITIGIWIYWKTLDTMYRMNGLYASGIF